MLAAELLHLPDEPAGVGGSGEGINAEDAKNAEENARTVWLPCNVLYIPLRSPRFPVTLFPAWYLNDPCRLSSGR
jgi:hypothetical protein